MNKYFILSISNQTFAATVFINDIPVFTDNLRNELDKTVHINQYVIEGRNDLSAVLHIPGDLHELADAPLEFRFKVDFILAESEDSMTTTTILNKIVELIPGTEFPFSIKETFNAPDAYGRFEWESARRWTANELDKEGAIELAEKIFDGFQNRDFNRISPQLKWKRMELGRCYGFPMDELEADDKELFDSLFSNSNWALEPFDRSNLVFDLWAEGRIVQIIRPNGNELIRTVRLKESDVIYSLPLILAFINGQWRLIR